MKIKNLIITSSCVLFLYFSTPVLAQNSNVSYQIPELFLSESMADINGKFDGNPENSVILFQNEELIFEAEIIDETQSSIKIKTPPLTGIYRLIIDEAIADFFVETTVRVAEMELDIGKTNMRNGQKTQLTIIINGLEGYTKPVAVSIKNLSPSVIKLPNGDYEKIFLQNEEGRNTINKKVEIRAITRGSFDIEVNMEPEKVLIHYDSEQLLKEIDKMFEDSSVVFAIPESDTLGYFKDLIVDNSTGRIETTSEKENEKIAKELAGQINKYASDSNIFGSSSPDLQKWIKKLLENYPVDSLKYEPNENASEYPTTSSRKFGYSGDKGDRNDSTTCNCRIEGAINHKVPQKCYTLAKLLKKQEVIQKLRKKGLEIPEKKSDGFRGENLSIIPGTAYSTNYGDIVGGYANGVANMWGKDVENNSAFSLNFETEKIGAESSAKGIHYMRILPAKNEWSKVIGIAAASSKTNVKAIDPVKFEREFMKEFGRGKRTAEIGFMIYGIATTSGFAALLDGLLQLSLNTTLDATGVTARLEKRVTTDADLYAEAKTQYHIKVNENKNGFSKKSTIRQVAKIDRNLKIKDLIQLKPTEINKKGTSVRNATPKEKSIIVSATHPTQVTATINAKATLICKALGNGVAESSVESKTATCVVGICVNQDGAMKYKFLQDSGIFRLGDKSKKIAEAETTKYEKAIDDYFKKLSDKMKGKSSPKIIKYINQNVEDDLKKIAANWLK